MNRIEIAYPLVAAAARDYVEARKAHAGQARAFSRLRDAVHLAMRNELLPLPDMTPPRVVPFRQRVVAAFRALCGEAA